jgi:hypothetical protein
LGEVGFGGVDQGFEAELGELFAGEGFEGVMVAGEGLIVIRLRVFMIVNLSCYP